MSSAAPSSLGSPNIINKLWSLHSVIAPEGYPSVLTIDGMLIHEVTSPQAFQYLEDNQLPIAYPDYIFGTLDHSIPTRPDRHIIHDEVARSQVELFRSNTAKRRLTIFDFESGHQGVVHVIGPELGIAQPGLSLVCGDSHTATLGAFGALAFGVGTSEVMHVMATGCVLQYRPKTMEVAVSGVLPDGVSAKDLILAIINRLGVGGANGHFIEYRGDTISGLDMDARMTICNMSIECGARGGLIGPDDVTFAYLKGRRYAPQGEQWDDAISYWRSLASTPDATYDTSIAVNAAALKPMITWGTNPAQSVAIDEPIPLPETLSPPERLAQQQSLAYTKLTVGKPLLGTPIQWAFLGSCTNARISDLRLAADIIKGRRVADGVTFLVVPGSESVRAQAIAEGLDKIFIEAGAQFRMPGCSMCLGMNDDIVPAGQRCISSSNRNFVGRQGPGSITHLASPATVTASALAGVITASGD
jgi:3-isopropylmalate/(R)-2-methylmalate dehydratase large subunit